VDTLLLGFAVGASFGPINILLTERALLYGRQSVIQFALGAWLGDVTLVLASLLALTMLAGNTIIQSSSFVRIIAGAILIGVAAKSSAGLRTYQRSRFDQSRVRRNTAFAFILTVTSPFGGVLWVTAVSVTQRASYSDGLIATAFSATLLVLGDLAWFMLWTAALLLLRGSQWLGGRQVIIIGLLAHLMLAGLGAYYIITGIAQKWG
jgi:threonine/homoserine/homoserine lactone efflux protein